MKMMLLIAHGSRKQAANDEIARLAQSVAARGGDEFAGVEVAFLELVEPNVQQGIERCIEMGASEIVAVPYFLAAGRHVAQDIPGELACARAGHPDIGIELSRYVGESEAMVELVLGCSRHTETI